MPLTWTFAPRDSQECTQIRSRAKTNRRPRYPVPIPRSSCSRIAESAHSFAGDRLKLAGGGLHDKY